MAIFGIGQKKEEGQQISQAPQMSQSQQMPPPPNMQQGSAVDDIARLRQQGLSNAKIIETLQRSGYKTHQIFDALNQADIGRTGEQIAGAPYFEEPKPQAQSQAQSMEQMPLDQGYAEPRAYASQSGMSQNYDEKIEEIAETIIEEKWNELLKDVNKIIEWKATMEANMKALEQRQQDIKQSFDNLQKALLAKIGDYDQNITSVGTELKALEKVFQKLLPAFTENVNELSRTVKELKKAK